MILKISNTAAPARPPHATPRITPPSPPTLF